MPTNIDDLIQENNDLREANRRLSDTLVVLNEDFNAFRDLVRTGIASALADVTTTHDINPLYEPPVTALTGPGGVLGPGPNPFADLKAARKLAQRLINQPVVAYADSDSVLGSTSVDTVSHDPDNATPEEMFGSHDDLVEEALDELDLNGLTIYHTQLRSAIDDDN